MKRPTLLILALCLSLACLPAMADPSLELSMEVKKEIRIPQENGHTLVEYAPADETASGDVLVYVIHYVNKGDQPAKNTFVQSPIPRGTVYVDESACGENCDMVFSIDEGRSFSPLPIYYDVPLPDGSSRKRKAGPHMITHAKWLMTKAIKPGESGVLLFKAMIR